MSQKRISKLRKARLNLGLSMHEVAADTGMPYSVLQRVEHGTQACSRKHARALYYYYDGEVSLADIYDPMFEYETVGDVHG